MTLYEIDSAIMDCVDERQEKLLTSKNLRLSTSRETKGGGNRAGGEELCRRSKGNQRGGRKACETPQRLRERRTEVQGLSGPCS